MSFYIYVYHVLSGQTRQNIFVMYSENMKEFSIGI